MTQPNKKKMFEENLSQITNPITALVPAEIDSFSKLQNLFELYLTLIVFIQIMTKIQNKKNKKKIKKTVKSS